MEATKKSFKLIDGIYQEKQYGPNCGLEWTDASNNTYRAIVTNLAFDVNGEKWPVYVTVYLKPTGKSTWFPERQIIIIADENSFRNKVTGEKAERSKAFDISYKYWNRNVNPAEEVLREDAYEIPKDKDGNDLPERLKLGFTEEKVETLNSNYITSGEFFTKLIGYNPQGLPISIFEYIYQEIALKEGLTL